METDINIRKEEIQDECVQKFIDNNFYGAGLIGTGGGKTKMMLKCLSEIMERTKVKKILYCCNSIDLRDTDFPNEVIKWGYSNYLDKMDRLCYQSAYKLEDEHYDVGLFDEGDYALTPKYIKVFLNNTFTYLIFVSATLESKKLKILKSIQPKIPILYKKELSELEEESVLNKSRYYYVNYLLNDVENKRYLAYNRSISSLLKEDDTTQKQERLRFILQQRKLFLNKLRSSATIAKKLLDRIEGRTLIFSELTEQIDRITPYTYHGKNSEDENLQKFDNQEIDTLGVCGKVDRGVNIRRVENIILESGSSSKTKIVQKLGRGKRLEVDEFLNVYLLVPHYKAQFPKDTIKPTIVAKWFENALKDFNIPKDLINTYKF